MAVKVGERALVLKDEIQNAVLNTEFTSFKVPKVVKFDSAIIGQVSLTITTASGSRAGTITASKSNASIRFSSETLYGNASYSTNDSGKTFTLNNMYFDNMLTGKSYEEDDMIILDEPHIITTTSTSTFVDQVLKFIEMPILEFNGIYKTKEIPDGTKIKDYQGVIHDVPFDVTTSLGLSYLLSDQVQYCFAYLPGSNQYKIMSYQSNFHIASNGDLYILAQSNNANRTIYTYDIATNKQVASTSFNKSSTGHLFCNINTDIFTVNKGSQYPNRALSSSQTAMGSQIVQIACDQTKLTWETQSIGIQINSGDVLKGTKYFDDSGVGVGTLGGVTSKDDLLKLDMLVEETRDYNLSTCLCLFQNSDLTKHEILRILDTSKCTEFERMFSNNKNLKEVDLKYLDLTALKGVTSEVKFTGLLESCPSLTKADNLVEKLNELSSTIDSGASIYYAYLISGDSNLEIDLTDLDISKVTNFGYAFQGASKASMDVSNWDFSRVESIYSLFAGKEITGGGHISGPNVTGYENIKFHELPRSLSLEGLFKYNDHLINVNWDGLNSAKSQVISHFMYGCSNLETLKLTNFKPYNTGSSYLANLHYMFAECPKLREVDLTGMGSSYAKTFWYMFQNDVSLEKVIAPEFTTLSTSSIQLSGMFNNCTSLKHLDLRAFPFSKATEFTNAFTGVPNDCLIIVKDDTQKAWFTTNWSNLTNVKTVAEYEG